jgi:hypothetical protein
MRLEQRHRHEGDQVSEKPGAPKKAPKKDDDDARGHSASLGAPKKAPKKGDETDAPKK